MKTLVQKSLAKAMDYEAYMELFKQLVAEGKTSGEQTQEKIDYTKLNFSRSKRIAKTISLSPSEQATFQETQLPQTWLVLTEPWCGDAAQALPLINMIAKTSENIELKILLRDENDELMNHFLTNGGKAIPKLLVVNEDSEITHNWGPRSAAATKLVTDYKAKHGIIDDTIKTQLQTWYNDDKGNAIITELSEVVLAQQPKHV